MRRQFLRRPRLTTPPYGRTESSRASSTSTSQPLRRRWFTLRRTTSPSSASRNCTCCWYVAKLSSAVAGSSVISQTGGRHYIGSKAGERSGVGCQCRRRFSPLLFE